LCPYGFYFPDVSFVANVGDEETLKQTYTANAATEAIEPKPHPLPYKPLFSKGWRLFQFTHDDRR
jgi:hypothetical protein